MMLSPRALASIVSKIIGSSIKQALLPSPVGRQPNTSLLRTKLMIMLACSGFSSSYPRSLVQDTQGHIQDLGQGVLKQ